MKNKSLIYLFFLSAAALSFLILLNLLLPRFVWINEPVHSSVEAFGSLAAILLSIMLLHRQHEEGWGRLFWVANGLLSMGLLDGLHSVSRLGHGFILLHSVACFSGGFWFALVWLPESNRFSRIKKWLPYLVAAGSELFGVWILLFRETMPLMMENGKFTNAAILLNILAGVFFLAATGRFLLDFYRSGKREFFLFSCMALLLGLANLFFSLSAVWDNIWWSWHLLRLSSFHLALWFVLKSDLQTISALNSSIAGRERIEKALRESNEYLENLFNYANAPIIVWDPSFRITRFNHAFESLTGRRSDEVIGKPLEILFPPDLVESSMELIRETQTGQRWEAVEINILRCDGSVRTVLWNSANLFTPDGKTPVATIAQGQDITERKHMEGEYSTLIQTSLDGFFVNDFSTRIKDVNESLCKMLGYTRQELLCMSIPDIEAIESPDETAAHIRKIMETGSDRFQSRHRRKDGTILDVEISVQYVAALGKRFFVFVRDITGRLKLEAQYLHSQKMESIGTLAGGVAHDFNNILSTIIGYGHMAIMKLEKYDPQRLSIENMLEAADRAAHLTKDLLLFSRKQMSERKAVDLNDIIRKVEKFLRRVIGEDIECRTMLHDLPLTVLADSHQLEQVLMNFATNARDAMPKGGIFSIATEQIALEKDFVSAHGFGTPGPYALITVTDIGIGMDKDTRQRIFDPFFTTKEVGKGTGLGLAVVFGIIEQHKGHINVYSEPGKGTIFRIYLPLISDSVTEEEKEPEAVSLRRGTETILVAEDDQALRILTTTVLREFGYEVIEAVDGADAVKKFMENRDRIHLLLFDLIMPKMNGKEAYDEIIKAKPGVKAIFASGYAPETIRQKALLDNSVSVIFKPVLPTNLLKKVRSVLDEKAA